MKSQDIFKQIKEQAKAKEQSEFNAKEQVWHKIETELNENRDSNRKIPWLPWSIAASILILVGFGFWFLNQENTIDLELIEESVATNKVKVKEHKETQAQHSILTDTLPPYNIGDKTLDEMEQTTIATKKKDEFKKQQENLTPPSPVHAIKIRKEVQPLHSTAKSSNNLTKSKSIKIGSTVVATKPSRRNMPSNGRRERVIIDKNAKPLNAEISNRQGGYIASVPTSKATHNLNNLDVKGSSSNKQENQPLYVLDGKPISASDLSNISGNQIEKVNIIKDAMAREIYGEPGINGVIEVETKKITERSKQRLRKAYRDSINKLSPTHNQDTVQLNFKVEVSNESYEKYLENPFESPQVEPLSTFSIDVDNASYSNIRRFLNNGQTVPKDAIRVEEMINYFNYAYDQPKGNNPLAIHTEMSVAPWNPNHKLLKVGLQAKKIESGKLPASNIVFLIDVSGSMSAQNKLPLLKSSIQLLVDNLRAEDKVSVVVYAGAAGLVLPATPGDKKQTILNALDNLKAGGSTAGGAGIELAYRIAQEHFIKDGNNRIIIATDGDFNVGATSNQAMEDLIEEKRKLGIFLTVLGYGMGNYKDDKMEILADKGNGNYAYIDNMQEANKFLVREFGGTLFTVAKDVKVQIEFNPYNVQAYRLIGYENRRLRPEDFKNDAIDAGEMGSGHTVTALYEIIPKNVDSNYFISPDELKYNQTKLSVSSFGNELGTVRFRYKNPDGIKSKQLIRIIPNNTTPIAFASTDFKFASAVAWFGLKLRDSKYIPNKNSSDIKQLAKKGKGTDDEGYRAEFIRLVDMVK